jgi:hypothetical protein
MVLMAVRLVKYENIYDFGDGGVTVDAQSKEPAGGQFLKTTQKYSCLL